LNVLDEIDEIRDGGSGLGIDAPQFGPPHGLCNLNVAIA